MSEVILETKNLCKLYGKTTALDNASVKFESGKIYGLLGRNGAGKTTLLNLVSSRIFATSGEIEAFGQNVVENEKVLSKICYMPEKNMFMKSMKVSETIKFASQLYENFDMDFAKKLSEKFGLDLNKKYKALSRGYESILRIVIGLAARTPITIFDEPVLGLDAAVRDDFYKVLLDDYTENPRTMIISTHLIEESADIFDEAVIIKGGHIIEQTPCEVLKARGHYISGKAADVDRLTAGLNVIHNESVANVKISTVYGSLDKSRLKELADAGLEISPVPVQKLFIYLTDKTVEGGIRQ